jgi:hypothetical protein
VSRARATALVAVVALLGSGCATIEGKVPSLAWLCPTPPSAPEVAVAGPPVPPPAPPPVPPSRVADPVHLVTRANELARDGMPLAARDLYEQVIRDYPEHPVRAGALFGLGQLQADPAGPLRDYRVAYLTFGRVFAEHPRSRWEAEARRYRGLLNELQSRDDETHRLRVQLQKLRRIEVDLDKSR